MTRTKLRSTLIATERERCAKIADQAAGLYFEAATRRAKEGHPGKERDMNRHALVAVWIAREIRSGK